MPGALQVPPDGAAGALPRRPPATGGYPVLGVVHPADLWLAAQARPGTRLRFGVVPGHAVE